MKTFTFKYDPKASLKGMFDDFKNALKTGQKDIEKDSMTSQSIEAIFTTMTRAKLDLFYCIARQKPSSLYQLAQLLERDQANVLRDARVLEAMGLLDLKKVQENGRERLQPVALYDRIVFDFGSAISRPRKQSIQKKKIKRIAS